MMTIKTQLLAALGGIFLCISIIAGSGLYSATTANEGLQSVYNERVVATRELKIVSDLYAVNVVDAAHKVNNGNWQWSEGIAALRRAKEGIAEHWAAYLAGEQDAQEKPLVARIQSLQSAADRSVDELLQIMSASDATALDNFVKLSLYPSIDPITDAISSLVDVQLAGAGDTYASAAADFRQSQAITFAALLIGVAALGFSLWTTLYKTVRPLGALTAAMRQLADGRLDTIIPCEGQGNELGQMAAAVVIFRENAFERRRLEESARASQDIERAKGEALQGHILAFRQIVTKVLAGVNDGTDSMKSMADLLSNVAGDAAGRAASARSASGEASINVQTVATAAEELAASTREIADQAQRASTIVAAATEIARATDEDVSHLAAAAERVGNVVSLINSIAEQTNLLALNATIEAARAGEAGRGFAVVAAEVKALANQTAKATEEISSQIAGIQASTGKAVGSIRTIGERVSEINGLNAAIAAAVEEQEAVTREISQSIGRAAAGSTEVAENVDGVSAAIADTSAEAQRVHSVSNELARAARELSAAIDGFLANVTGEGDARQARKAA
jgi:methyl-accepting chemotaxis protein